MTLVDKLINERAARLGIGDLEAESDRNLLAYYAAELRWGRFKSISKDARRNLRRLGLISVERSGRYGAPVYSLTVRGKDLLEEVI